MYGGRDTGTGADDHQRLAGLIRQRIADGLEAIGVRTGPAEWGNVSAASATKAPPSVAATRRCRQIRS